MTGCVDVMSGTARNGRDFDRLSGFVTIPANKSTAEIKVSLRRSAQVLSK